DAAFAEPDGSSLGDATDALTTELAAHLSHEEHDGLPLIGVALTSAEWRRAGFKIARHSGLSGAAEMFAWIADGARKDEAAAAIGTLPPPARVLYRAIWNPRYHRVKRW
ncbi:MAG TPA: hemerythrin domain-containing protein, partial [Trebonia sp.]|nr:hemerythrin domain-containing protein [Trebonia sp.]